MSFGKHYNLPFRFCTCRTNGALTEHGSTYRIFETEFKRKREKYPDVPKGEIAREILDKMGIVRSCCRNTIINPPCYPMVPYLNRGVIYDTMRNSESIQDQSDILPRREIPHFF